MTEYKKINYGKYEVKYTPPRYLRWLISPKTYVLVDTGSVYPFKGGATVWWNQTEGEEYGEHCGLDRWVQQQKYKEL